MIAKTTINVNCAENGKVAPYNGIVVGRLMTVVMLPSVQANWSYEKEDGTLLMSGTSTIDTATADAVLGANAIDSMAKADLVFYGVLKTEMASALGISENDIIIE